MQRTTARISTPAPCAGPERYSYAKNTCPGATSGLNNSAKLGRLWPGSGPVALPVALPGALVEWAWPRLSPSRTLAGGSHAPTAAVFMRLFPRSPPGVFMRVVSEIPAVDPVDPQKGAAFAAPGFTRMFPLPAEQPGPKPLRPLRLQLPAQLLRPLPFGVGPGPLALEVLAGRRLRLRRQL